MLEVRHVSVSIARSPADVYRFASDPENLPKWASGLGGSIRQVDGSWLADGPLGKIEITFTPANELGVLDHAVRLESGATFQNPMRVIANENGSELTFTVFRRPGITTDTFQNDAQWVEKDLRCLKNLLEK